MRKMGSTTIATLRKGSMKNATQNSSDKDDDKLVFVK